MTSIESTDSFHATIQNVAALVLRRFQTIHDRSYTFTLESGKMSLAAFDIVAFLDDNHIDYSSDGNNVSSGWIGVQCPFCPDPSNHLGINLSAKTINCWACPTKGTIKKYIHKVLNVGWGQVNQIIEKHQNRELIGEYGHYVKSRASSVSLPDGVHSELLDIHRKYLVNRRFDPDFLQRKYGVLGGQYHGLFKYRIVVPVFFEGEVVSYIGRDITGQAEERYKNLPVSFSKFSPKETLYNIDSVKDKAILVEGILDAWRIGDGAVSTSGTKVTSEQIAMLSGLKEVYVLFDSREKDSNAPEQAEEVAHRVASVVNKVEILELSGGDPADMTDQEVQSLRWEIFQ